MPSPREESEEDASTFGLGLNKNVVFAIWRQKLVFVLNTIIKIARQDERKIMTKDIEHV